MISHQPVDCSFNLTGKDALITGAAGGIGESSARRFTEVDEIASTVRSLSCDESNTITGEDLVADGGFNNY